MVPSSQVPTYRGLWEFTRPHTLIGSALCVPAIHAFATPSGAPLFTARLFQSCVWALIPALFINIYITGLNQITDVEIDRVNKPYLPLAAGHLTMPEAKWVVGLSLLAGLALGFLHPCSTFPLRMTLVLSALIGTFYSLEPFRFKRFPFFAALCILTVRGAVINIGFYGHAVQNLGLDVTAQNALASPVIRKILSTLPFESAKCGLATLFFALFGTVIALMKDVPDVVGDKLYGIKSLTVRLGPERVFTIARDALCLLMGVTGGALAATGALLVFSQGVVGRGLLRVIVGASSLMIARTLKTRSCRVDTADQGQVYQFYMFVWKVFYASYIFLPFVR